MVELVCDVLSSLAGDGFKRVFCVTGHGDATHNRAIHTAVKRSAEKDGIDISFLAEEGLIRRLQIELDDPNVTLYQGLQPPTPPKFPDIHAGRGETAAMMEFFPDLVRHQKLASLNPVDFTMEQLTEWRRGHDFSKRLTPLG